MTLKPLTLVDTLAESAPAVAIAGRVWLVEVFVPITRQAKDQTMTYETL